MYAPVYIHSHRHTHTHTNAHSCKTHTCTQSAALWGFPPAKRCSFMRTSNTVFSEARRTCINFNYQHIHSTYRPSTPDLMRFLLAPGGSNEWNMTAGLSISPQLLRLFVLTQGRRKPRVSICDLTVSTHVREVNGLTKRVRRWASSWPLHLNVSLLKFG